MTQENIIRMAREAGFAEYEVEDYTPSGYDIRYERFAALVAAHEREACAKHVSGLRNGDDYGEFLAAAIRARGNK